MFHYSSKNRHVLAELQKAYGGKTLQMVKAATTRWLSHGAACKKCGERYSIILEGLDDLVSENQNAEWIQYRFTLLEEKTVFEICFLEDVLSITHVLCLVLLTDKKDFGAQELLQAASRYLKKFLLIRTLICLKVSTPHALI